MTVLTLASLTELLSGLETGYDVSSVHTVMFGGSSAREGEANTVKERLPTIKQIKQCTYMITNTTPFVNPFSTGTVFIRQNLTCVDVRF